MFIHAITEVCIFVAIISTISTILKIFNPPKPNLHYWAADVSTNSRLYEHNERNGTLFIY